MALRSRRKVYAGVAALLFITLSIILISQGLQHDVTITLKLIQVMVTDKDGNPVTDLNKEDFLLFDNDREQTLTEFERHDIRQARTPISQAKPVPRKEISANSRIL